MAHIGIFSFVGTGHLNPATALGRRLVERGHDVTIFHFNRARAAIRDAGLRFRSIDDRSEPVSSNRFQASKEAPWVKTLQALESNALAVLRNAPDALRLAKVNGLVVDQADLAAGTVAESMGLPFVNLSTSPPVLLDDSVPPPYFNWRPRDGAWSRRRNGMGNALISRALAPIVERVNQFRSDWGLRKIRHLNEIFSQRAIIAQIPEFLDFPRPHRPSFLFYAGPFRDARNRRNVEFPWAQLDGRPVVYASLGTVRNDEITPFRIIASACAGLNVQLVISLGGGMLRGEDIGPLAGSPIVVHYAPQLELLKNAALTITHAGMNTTLESLAEGVPILAIPITDDQPGVAARIASAGVGVVIPIRSLTTSRLVTLLREVLENNTYRATARRVQLEISRLDGLETSAGIAEAQLEC